MTHRTCIRCGMDLADTMGVIVFIDGQPTDHLLCVDDGAGRNSLTSDQFRALSERTTDTQRCLDFNPHEPHYWLFMLTDRKWCPGACACQHQRDCDH